MNHLEVRHSDTREYIYPVSRNILRTNIYCSLIDSNNDLKVKIVYWNRFVENDEKTIQMNSFSKDNQSKYYTAEIKLEESAKYLKYYFVISNELEEVFFSSYGLSKTLPSKTFEYQSTNELDVFEVPKWANGIVGYQIFPERFFKGSSSPNGLSLEKWDSQPSRTNFFGGNLRGIIDKFNYIRDLGVRMIYLTPIFLSNSNHKYDTVDYFKIDPNFGDIDDLKNLVELCHNNDMKLILDGVFNHIGYYSSQFQDVIKKGKASKYWDWFYIHGDSVDVDKINYECVGYYKWMPKLRYSSNSLRKYILSVGEYWISAVGIDGWRLDVSDEVDFTFLQEFRKTIKSVNEDALLIGETWKDGRDLLRGDQMDSIMNYRFRDISLDYFANESIDTNTFKDRIENILFNYPSPSHNALYNLLGSHDTERISTICKSNWEKEKLLIVFQMTYPGMPVVYYGDEIGLEGETDPDCRQTMKWCSVNEKILEFYKRMIKIRNENDSLKYGSFSHLNLENGLYGFVREFKNDSIIVVINKSDRFCQFNLNKIFDNMKSELIDIDSQKSKIIKITREGEKMTVTCIKK